MKNIAIFASGNGANAEAIIKYFAKHTLKGRVALLVSNNEEAYALKRAQNHNIATIVFNRSSFYQNTTPILNELEKYNIDFIALAGFMLLFPPEIVEKYENRIVNIHPALLPAYGGKGMYGDNVHKAVIAAGEKESGITIHLVDSQYDKGKILFQAKVALEEQDSAQSLAEKIHELEHKYFSTIIEQQL